MSDLISRSYILNIIEMWMKVSSYSEAERNIMRAIDYEVRTIPSAQQWIPVTERLPELKERVLVYAEDDKSWYIAISQIISPPSPKVYFLGFNGTQKVKAWMPLPKPYDGEIK